MKRIFMFRMIFIVVLLLALNNGNAQISDFNPSTTLWYEQAANEWEEALPIGNGRLGAMVFGAYDEERDTDKRRDPLVRRSIFNTVNRGYSFCLKYRKIFLRGSP